LLKKNKKSVNFTFTRASVNLRENIIFIQSNKKQRETKPRIHSFIHEINKFLHNRFDFLPQVCIFFTILLLLLLLFMFFHNFIFCFCVFFFLKHLVLACTQMEIVDIMNKFLFFHWPFCLMWTKNDSEWIFSVNFGRIWVLHVDKLSLFSWFS
jgi:hypothetical protein